MRITKAVLTATVLAALAGGAALAETPHEMREAHMKAQAKALGVLGAMVQEKAPYDAAAAKAAAEELAALAGKDWTPLFPAGSTEGEGNRALPAIWENMEDFMIKHKDLIAAAAALVPVAGTDLASLKAGFGPVGAACGACHKNYRKPE